MSSGFRVRGSEFQVQSTDFSRAVNAGFGRFHFTRHYPTKVGTLNAGSER